VRFCPGFSGSRPRSVRPWHPRHPDFRDDSGLARLQLPLNLGEEIAVDADSRQVVYRTTERPDASLDRDPERSTDQPHQAAALAFDKADPGPVGTVAARVALHHGLRDARTLDAYVATIDTAQSHVYTVNGLPLILETQHSLLRALRRGVRVRTLFGNLTPPHAGTPFEGP